MKADYDFSKAEKGKFYRPTEEFQLPIYLDKDVQEFFYSIAVKKNQDLSTIVNSLLKEELKIHQDILSENEK